MAERTRKEQRERRSGARERRRSLAAKPFEELDEAAGAEEGGDESHSTLRRAAKTAAAGAVAAGIAGAAKALADRREREPEHEPEQKQPPEQEHSQARAEPEPEPEREPEEEPAEEEHLDPQAEAEAEQSEQAPDGEPQAAAAKGASANEIAEIVEEAKRQLQELLGIEPEAVSGFNRSDGRWTVALEVVTVHRVPETTDVLSSYEVAFDDDHNLVSLTETRRYRRSQVEEGR